MTARWIDMLQRASVLPYTKEELKKLEQLILNEDIVTWADRYQGFKSEPFDYDSVRDAINDQLKFGGFFVDRPEEESFENCSEIDEYQVRCRGKFLGRPLYEKTHSDLKPINFLQYLLVYHLRIFLFLVCIPIDQLHMYINYKDLALFTQWRLEINK